jgi:phosphatidylinositol alpha-1,6-mannosyltransferase
MQKLVQEGHCVDYLIVGSGPKVQSLRALTRELGLEDIVRFQLSATDEQVAEAFACCDIFVMPSVATATDLEGFGIVYIEAAMHGLVSISGNVGGCAEAVLDRETGLVVDGRDPQALYEALEELILHPELRKELGNRGRRRAQAELTWPHVVGQMQHMMIGETTPMKG